MTLSELNSLAKSGPAELIQRGEAAYMSRVRRAAEAIAGNLKESNTVLLAGPSGSGKTTTAKLLAMELTRMGIKTHTVSMDNYFKCPDTDDAPRDENGEVDYESPDLMDMELLNLHFSELSKGREIRVPRFDFAKRMRSERSVPLRLDDNEAAIFEGIHALNDRITDKNPGAFTVFVEPDVELALPDGAELFGDTVRLLRRIVRDNNFRGASAEYTLSLWPGVVRGEGRYIAPFAHKARAAIDTSLIYDVAVLAPHALPLLMKVGEDSPYHGEAQGLLAMLERVGTIDDTLVPEASLMREFIGDGTK